MSPESELWMKVFADSLNRRVEVETLLLDVADGKRPPPTPEECKQLAFKLGIPDKWKEGHFEGWTVVQGEFRPAAWFVSGPHDHVTVDKKIDIEREIARMCAATGDDPDDYTATALYAKFVKLNG